LARGPFFFIVITRRAPLIHPDIIAATFRYVIGLDGTVRTWRILILRTGANPKVRRARRVSDETGSEAMVSSSSGKLPAVWALLAALLGVLRAEVAALPSDNVNLRARQQINAG
jgi:hypothetical protein